MKKPPAAPDDRGQWKVGTSLWLRVGSFESIWLSNAAVNQGFRTPPQVVVHPLKGLDHQQIMGDRFARDAFDFFLHQSVGALEKAVDLAPKPRVPTLPIAYFSHPAFIISKKSTVPGRAALVQIDCDLAEQCRRRRYGLNSSRLKSMGVAARSKPQKRSGRGKYASARTLENRAGAIYASLGPLSERPRPPLH
jgi:hypothetical protein